MERGDADEKKENGEEMETWRTVVAYDDDTICGWNTELKNVM